jgi:hypothetical protein
VIYIAADEIFKIGVVSAIRYLYRRQRNLQNWYRTGSTRSISPPTKSSKLVSYRLYVIHIAANKDLQNWCCPWLYVIYIDAADIHE